MAGCVWACKRIGLPSSESLEAACSPLRLPFRVVPGLAGFCVDLDSLIREVAARTPLHVLLCPRVCRTGAEAAGGTDICPDHAAVAGQVPFQAELLVTRDGRKVKERRETCWMAEPGIGGLAYSGKIMSPVPFTPHVRSSPPQRPADLAGHTLRTRGENAERTSGKMAPSGRAATLLLIGTKRQTRGSFLALPPHLEL